MFCKQCGNQLPDSASFCTKCGASQKQAPQEAPQQAQQQNQAFQQQNYPQQNYQQQNYQQQPYPQRYAQPQGNAQPQQIHPLRTNRALWKVILFSMLTFGIYGLVVYCNVSSDINTVASRYDGKRTMHFALLTFLVAPITLGIAVYVWNHKISARMGNELQRRGIAYSFGAADFWLWGILGGLVLVGPFVYAHKLLKAMNLLAEDYNVRG